MGTLHYHGESPVTEKQIVEWLADGIDTISVNIEVALADLIDMAEWAELDECVDDALGISLTDLDYGVNHIQTGQRENDIIVIKATGKLKSDSVSQSDTWVRFHPQAWQNDNAVDVDSDSDGTWLVAEVTADQIEKALAKGEHLDFVIDDPFAPKWVRYWPGPYTIEKIHPHGYGFDTAR